jgi:hypothetical protein
MSALGLKLTLGLRGIMSTSCQQAAADPAGVTDYLTSPISPERHVLLKQGSGRPYTSLRPSTEDALAAHAMHTYRG